VSSKIWTISESLRNFKGLCNVVSSVLLGAKGEGGRKCFRHVDKLPVHKAEGTPKFVVMYADTDKVISYIHMDDYVCSYSRASNAHHMYMHRVNIGNPGRPDGNPTGSGRLQA
jgi:hypothetical protein